MPKIIADLQEKIIYEANELLFSKGYQSMTMRSVADKCGIAVGTVYNYYKSKDVLVAEIMLKDWVKIMEEVKRDCEGSVDIHEAFKIMFDGVSKFTEKFDVIFTQYGKETNIRKQMPIQFTWLINQLSGILDEVLVRCHGETDEYMSVFLAEILLQTATKKDFEYDNISRILKRIFK